MVQQVNGTRVRAYARLLDGGIRTIDEVQEEYRVPVCVECIAEHNWTTEKVDLRYREEVEKIVGAPTVK